MDSTDISNRKPRKFKGTPAVKVRSYISIAAIVYTLITGTILMLSPFDSEFRDLAKLQYEARKEEDLETTEEEKLKRSLMFQTFMHVTQGQKSDAIEKANREKEGL